jgi:hypothetical protein
MNNARRWVVQIIVIVLRLDEHVMPVEFALHNVVWKMGERMRSSETALAREPQFRGVGKFYTSFRPIRPASFVGWVTAARTGVADGANESMAVTQHHRC